MTRGCVGVVKESAAWESRVAMVPDVVGRLRDCGVDVMVEAGAGERAFVHDGGYEQAGASVVTAAELDASADILLCVQAPAPERVRGLRSGQILIGLLEPHADPQRVAAWAECGLTTLSLDLLPRTLSRAQPMDALSSQANVAGYKAVLVAASAFGGFFPMMMTAAGTARPATVLVMGAGVAGLAAIGTARRLGAVVTGYDIRPQARDDVRSLGAQFLQLDIGVDGAGTGGYARELSPAERAEQQAALEQRIGGFDVVITTAQVPGRRPPLLVTDAALKLMRSGSVVVDLAAGPLGGNVEGSLPQASLVVADGVTVIGAANLPSTMAPAASSAFARNVSAVVAAIVRDGRPAIDPTDELQQALLVTHAGTVVSTLLGGSDEH